MNYIARLQGEAGAAHATIAAKNQAVQEFQVHLHGEKFRGFEPDGSRKDWIAVADVLAWLTIIKDAESGQADDAVEPA
jgi:hypothetical protein